MDNFQQIDPKYLALIQAGAGILAANNGRVPAGAAIGQGLLGGASAYQEGLQNQQMMQMRNDQIDAQRQLFGARAGEIQAEGQQRTNRNNALNAWKQQNPALANLADIDFATAYKAANPSLTEGKPYFTPIYDVNKGLGSFDTRTGNKFFGDGDPIIRPQDSPKLQAQLSGAKSYGENLYNPTDIFDGRIMPKSLLAIESGAPSLDFLTPSAPQMPTTQIPPNVPKKGDKLPSMVISPEVQKGRDDKRLQILEEEVAREGGEGKNPELDKELARVRKQLGVQPPTTPNVGIKVPTKAEQAADTQRAKDDAEFNSPENVKKREQLKQFKKTTAQNVVSSIDSVLDRVDNWSAGVGGNIARALPFNNDAKDIAADIETVKANFGFDRLQAMRDMSPTGGALGQVAVQELTALQASVANLDPTTQSPSQLKRNLEKAKTHYSNWLGTIDDNKNTESEKPTVTPPKAAIDALRLSPKLQADFDAKYGAGASQQYLGK